jgi:hypothetical protein
MAFRAASYVAVSLLAATSSPSLAEVTRFEVVSSDKPALQGRTFGERGTAEKITARATIGRPPLSGPG